jgi:Flp pilus assembly pilin Flp
MLKVLKNDRGATMVEYSILIVLIAAICVAAVTQVGTDTVNLFSSVSGGW